MTALHQYLLFGLRVASTRRIPSLLVDETGDEGDADVAIAEGEVRLPESAIPIDGGKLSVIGDTCVLQIDECGSFEIRGGKLITVQPESGATAEQVNLYLVGSVFGALLHQRRLLPFHCNAVEIEGSAFLFCGDSGAGKSTLAAYFVERGHRLLSDDVCALHFDADGQLLAAPGVARLKLWRETLEMFDRPTGEFELVPWYEDKFEVPLKDRAAHWSAPVAGIYHLRVAEDGRLPGIFPLEGLQAANAITANIYRRRLGDAVGGTASYLATAARIVTEVAIFSMNREWSLSQFRAGAEAAENHMRALVAPDRHAGENLSRRRMPASTVRT